MERLTTDKPNGMYELAHNGCYIDEYGCVRYRDFDVDIDARELVRDIMREFGIWEFDDVEMLSDEVFDETIRDYLQYGSKEYEGLIALFYRNLWAMAELREKLKNYETLEEQGLLLKLPCKVGEKVYVLWTSYNFKTDKVEHSILVDVFEIEMMSDFGKTVFLTREEAEAKLQEMVGE